MRRAYVTTVLAMAMLFWVGPVVAASPADKCEAAKNKLAGKYAFCRQKAVAKAIKTGDPVDYSKCDSSFALKWAKTETNGGSMCPTNGDLADVQNQITDDTARIASRLGDERFVDNGDGTISDAQTGLMWEMKTNVGCPAGYTASGNYTTTVSTGTFVYTVDASATTWTGTGNDSGIGPISCSGTVTGTSLSGTCDISSGVTIAATIDCVGQSISINISGLVTGSGSGIATGSNVHDFYRRFSWSVTNSDPDGTAFTTFLAALDNSTSSDGSTVSGCFASHCDWRLPTSAELQTILLSPFSCGQDPCIDPIFGPTGSDFYWSGTTDAGLDLDAWVVKFGDGFLDVDDKSDSNHVRAVSGGL
jgi:Protein of unknown function (DUF1566)